jgi:DNA repair protein RecO (recombination protein O)
LNSAFDSVKHNQQPGYVLHTRPYSETSLLVDVFSRHHGRFMLLAKGARRQKSTMRGMLLPFTPLLLSWAGKGQLPILTVAEPGGYAENLSRQWVQSGYYVNELILKLLHRFDEHARLYDYYDHTIQALSSGTDASSVLRVFEKRLLQEIGFGMILDHDVETGEAIDPNGNYHYVPHRGPVLANGNRASVTSVSGSTLRALQEERFDSAESSRQARTLSRSLIIQQLGGKELRSRRVMLQVQRYRKM